jgi:hypothetical protein
MIIIAPWSQFSQQGSPTPLREFHRHNDMELTLLRSGRLNYEMNGCCAPIPPGRLCLLWGGIPHRWAEWSSSMNLQVLCLPMSFFLGLKLPPAFVHALLTGHVVGEIDGAREPVDDHLMREWAENIASGRPELRKVVEMEIESRLHRLALTQPRKRLHPLRVCHHRPAFTAVASSYRESRRRTASLTECGYVSNHKTKGNAHQSMVRH